MDTTRTILHVDMDSFYASVEVLLDPTLAGKPVIVGGRGERGVVASCNYEARSYGIHSAMPSVRARRLCPHAVFLQGRFEVYRDTSRHLHDIFRSYTPLVEGISLDEAFLDVTGARRLFGSGPEIGRALRSRVADEVGLACAVGVAPNKFLAKLASKAAKPAPGRPGQGSRPGRGVVVVEPGEELAFLHPLPVRALWGVGPATYDRLARFGIATVADLAATPVETLVAALGKAQGQHLHELSWGRDDRPVVPEAKPKSVGHEETYARDLHDLDALGTEAVRMADAVAARLRKAGLDGRTVTIKVRFHDFRTITRSVTLPAPTAAAPTIGRAARDLLEAIDPGPGVRLFGVTVSNLAEAGDRQLTLEDAVAGDATGRGWEEASRAVDAVRQRFGDAAVGPAVLAGDDGLRLKREGDTQWGPSGARGRTDR
ncbi:MAG TPA: DNA polymerase IV [Acidimicrobiales bacterium]|nr:DNA polymerase IV [Acidimicrobiales bacterium]